MGDRSLCRHPQERPDLGPLRLAAQRAEMGETGWNQLPRSGFPKFGESLHSSPSESLLRSHKLDRAATAVIVSRKIAVSSVE